MSTPRPSRGVLFALLLGGTILAACAPTYVVVPERREGYTARDTLHGRLKGKDVRVTFQHITVMRVDTLVRWRTIYRDGPRIDTVFNDTTRHVDTVKVGTGGRRPTPRVDTVRVVVHDTVRIGGPTGRPGTGGTGTGTTGGGGGPTGPIILPRRLEDPRVDTVRITGRDTVRITVHDTVHIVDTLRTGGVDTVRIPGRRTLFVPPGQYPPEGQCRVWIYDKAPGQQARAAACNALGTIPAGAFILFGGEAWDFDYAGLVDEAGVPPEIVALKRNNGRGSTPARGRGRG